MRKHHLLLAVLVALLVLGALFGGAVAAQGPADPPGDANGDGVCGPCGLGPGGAVGRMMGRAMGPGPADGWRLERGSGDATLLDAVAEVTGLSVEEVRDALADGHTLEEVITENGSTAEAVVDEYITRRVEEFRGSRDDLVNRIHEGRFWGHRGLMGPFGDDTLADVIAEVTDQSVEDIRAALADGQTPEEIITSAGATVEAVVDAFIARREATLAALVAEGRLTQEQADAMLAHMQEQVTEQIEEGLSVCPGGAFGNGMRRGSGRGMIRGGARLDARFGI